MSAQDSLSDLQFKHRTVAGFHQVKAYADVNAQPIGSLRWDAESGEIKGVIVSRAQQRKGVATALLNEAKANGPKPEPQHSAIRTDKGDAWAHSVGGSLPTKNK